MAPYPVISGFMTGIGVIIILLQLGPLLGFPSESAVVAAVVRLPGQFLALKHGGLGWRWCRAVAGFCLAWAARSDHPGAFSLSMFNGSEDDPEGIIDPAEEQLLRQQQGRLLMLHLNGPVSFGVARTLKQRVKNY